MKLFLEWDVTLKSYVKVQRVIYIKVFDHRLDTILEMKVFKQAFEFQKF